MMKQVLFSFMWHNAFETKILFTGKDATIPFDESGHSATAIAEMENYVIGVIGTEEKNETDTQEGNTIENYVPEGNKEEEKPALENEAEENSETDVPEGNKTYVLEDNDISANESDDAPVGKGQYIKNCRRTRKQLLSRTINIKTCKTLPDQLGIDMYWNSCCRFDFLCFCTKIVISKKAKDQTKFK